VTTRDRTQEILNIKERDAGWLGYGSFPLTNLLREWENHRKSEACTPDFFVIRIVTLLEVFARQNVASLVDHDRKFTDRAIEFSKQIKVDFALVRDIQGRTITLGDILAHSLPINSFGQIIAYFDTLLGKPVRPLLESEVDRWETDVKKAAAKPIIEDYDALARYLVRLFEVRHILCHEAPRKKVYDPGEIDRFLDGAIRFTKTMEGVLAFEKFGRVPMTQAAMNAAAHDDLQKVEHEMGRLFSEVAARVKAFDTTLAARKDGTNEDKWHVLLEDEQAKWLSYRNARCEFDTYLSRGGTIRPVLWAGEANRLTKLRIADLGSWLKHDSKM
jgi:uncharacterized protein YecT (DUF1311 family)